MKIEDVQVGAKVRCVYGGIYYGLIGTIAKVVRNTTGKMVSFEVHDSQGKHIAWKDWYRHESFELLEPAPYDYPIRDYSISELLLESV